MYKSKKSLNRVIALSLGVNLMLAPILPSGYVFAEETSSQMTETTNNEEASTSSVADSSVSASESENQTENEAESKEENSSESTETEETQSTENTEKSDDTTENKEENQKKDTAESENTSSKTEEKTADSNQQVNELSTTSKVTNGIVETSRKQTCSTGYYANAENTYCCPVGSEHRTEVADGRTYNTCFVKGSDSSDSEGKDKKNDTLESLAGIAAMLVSMRGTHNSQKSDNGSTSGITNDEMDANAEESANAGTSEGNSQGQQNQGATESIATEKNSPITAIINPSPILATDSGVVLATIKPNVNIDYSSYRIFARFADFLNGGYKTEEIQLNDPFVLIPDGAVRPIGNNYKIYVTFVSKTGAKHIYIINYKISQNMTTITKDEKEAMVSVSSLTDMSLEELQKQSISVKGTIDNAEWDASSQICRVKVSGEYMDDQQSTDASFTINSQNIDNADECYASVGKDVALSRVMLDKDINGSDVLYDAGAMHLDGKEYGTDEYLNSITVSDAMVQPNPDNYQYMDIGGETRIWDPTANQWINKDGSAYTDEQLQAMTGITVALDEEGFARAYDAEGNQVSSENGFSEEYLANLKNEVSLASLETTAGISTTKTSVMDYIANKAEKIPVIGRGIGMGIQKIRDLFGYADPDEYEDDTSSTDPATTTPPAPASSSAGSDAKKNPESTVDTHKKETHTSNEENNNIDEKAKTVMKAIGEVSANPGLAIPDILSNSK